jgi:hypothetical protein
LERGNEVEVEVSIVAAAKLVPHAVEISTVRPCGVAGSIDGLEVEEYAGRRIVGSEDFKLLVNDVVLFSVAMLGHTCTKLGIGRTGKRKTTYADISRCIIL